MARRIGCGWSRWRCGGSLSSGSRSRRGRGLRCGRGSRSAIGGGSFAGSADVTDHRANLERIARCADQLDDRAGDRGGDFNRRLVGLDFGEHVTFVDRFAHVLDPVEQDAFLNVGTEIGHLDFLRH